MNTIERMVSVSGRAVRPAYTMVEIALAMAVASVLVVGVGTVLVLASRAVPQSASAPTPMTVPTARAADDISAELRYATGFKEMAQRAVAFTVPDRTGDGREETIRYAWSGTPGDPVTREFNGSTPLAVIADADDARFTFTKRQVTRTGEAKAWVTSNETLLASFTGWTGVSATNMNLTVGTSAWISQAFRIDPALIPSGARNLAITRVRLKMKKPLVGGNDGHVTIVRRQSAGNQLPATMPVGSTSAISFGLLTTSFVWVTASFSDVVFATPETELCILVKGPAATSAQVQYLNATGAPADSNYFRWTTDGGSSWLPTSGWDRNDAYYEVWGTWQSEQVQTAQTSFYYLTTVGVLIDAGDTVRSSARVLNEPEVAGP